MIRTQLVLLASLCLIGCGSASYLTETKIGELETQIRANQQTQEELKLLLDELYLAQNESTESIKAELTKTQTLIAESTRTISEPTQNPAEVVNDLSKTEWLEAEGKVLVGGIENITFTTEDITYQARVDTGATSSSLDAREITRFERDGDRWVRFQLYVDDEHFADIERPVVRWVRVYQSSGTDEGERRPVVEMAYQFGDIQDSAEFTLTDRSHLEFSALVGRNIMTDRMIVDVSESYIFSGD